VQHAKVVSIVHQRFSEALNIFQDFKARRPRSRTSRGPAYMFRALT